jgi:DNA gyrase subunit A
MSTHDYLLVFTDSGKVFRIKGYNVPAFSRTSKGIPIINLLQITRTEKVKALVPYSKDDTKKYLFFVTRNGIIKRTPIEEFENINRNGKIAIKLNDNDELAFIKGTNGEEEIIIAGSNGKAVRFKEENVRPMSRTARGVKGFNTDGGYVVGMAASEEGRYIFTVTENGYGKKTPLEEYRLTKRGAKGVRTVNITAKNGPLVSLCAVNGDEDLLIITDAGIMIRISLSTVSEHGRNTQGVRLINVAENCKVSAMEVVEAQGTAEETPAEPVTEPEEGNKETEENA